MLRQASEKSAEAGDNSDSALGGLAPYQLLEKLGHAQLAAGDSAGAGASFGEKALINDDVRGASVKVTSVDAELFYINRSRFNELLGEFIFGYFWLFLVIFVWAIVLTVCFVYYRLVRRNLALAAASPRSRVVLGF